MQHGGTDKADHRIGQFLAFCHCLHDDADFVCRCCHCSSSPITPSRRTRGNLSNICPAHRFNSSAAFPPWMISSSWAIKGSGTGNGYGTIAHMFCSFDLNHIFRVRYKSTAFYLTVVSVSCERQSLRSNTPPGPAASRDPFSHKEYGRLQKRRYNDGRGLKAAS